MRRLMLGALLGAAAIAGIGSGLPGHDYAPRPATSMRRVKHWWRGTRTSSSKIRNPEDPQQAFLIEAAAAKRARRAEKLDRYCRRSAWFNKAHGGCASVPPRLSIPYVAK